MKIGTLLCKLFGHKFVKEVIKDDYNFEDEYYPGMRFSRVFEYPFCVRCGLKANCMDK